MTQNHHTKGSHPIVRSQPEAEEHSLWTTPQDPPPYFQTGAPHIMASLWQNSSSRPTTNYHPSGYQCGIPSGQTQLASATRGVETNLFGPLSLGNPPPYSFPFEYSSLSVGAPTAGPPPLGIPPLGALPVAWEYFTGPHVTHPTVHHQSTGAFNADNERHRPARDASHPYLLPASCNSRKRMPGVTYESDVRKLQERCIRQGGEHGAIALLSQIFAKGVHKDALVRLRTGEEVASQTFGEGPGPVYLCFLQVEEFAAEDEGDQKPATRYTCRLCPGPRELKFSWKNERDVLRHLRKQHFGLSEPCDLCGKHVYTTGEMRSHRCVRSRHCSQ